MIVDDTIDASFARHRSWIRQPRRWQLLRLSTVCRLHVHRLGFVRLVLTLYEMIRT